jgi:hypothetical protein
MKSFIWISLLACSVLAMSQASMAQPTSKPASGAGVSLQEKWVMVYNFNLANPKSVDEVCAMLTKAGGIGYNGVLITDNKFFRWNEVNWDDYTKNLQKVRKAAKDQKMKVIACVCGQGTDMLSNDPNLAEGQPVVDAPFIAKGGTLVPADDDYKIVNGDFADVKDGLPVGWTVNGKNAAVDTAVKCDGKNSVRIKAATQIRQDIQLKPARYYRITCKIKSDGMDPAYQFNLYLTDSKNTRVMCYKPFGIQKTQDWTEYSWEFNTLDHPSMQINTGIWGDFPGTVWLADFKVQPGGFVNLIRRDGAPLKITSQDGKTAYEEGKDFAGAKDPKLGMAVINGNTISGIYDYWHEAPTVTLPAGSRIKDGQKVLASYCHSQTIMGYGTMCCMAEPKIWDLTREHMKRIHKALEPDAYCLPHDEIRHQGWDDSCKKCGMTSAQLLADNIRKCVEVVRKEDPGKQIYIENDMIDPFMNAKKEGLYYLMKGEGPWYGSWEGLDKDLIICNWNYFDNADRKKSLEFWAKKGYKQVLWGYYDLTGDAMVKNTTSWLKEAQEVGGVIGVMYTSWGPTYNDMEKWLRTCEEAARKN